MKDFLFTDLISFVGEAPKKFDGYKKYVSTGAVNGNIIESDDIELVDYSSRPSRANLVACSGDILFAKMAETEKTLLLDDETEKNIYSTGFCAIRAKENIIEPKALYYLLGSSLFLNQKNTNSSGATQRAITNTGLSKIRIKLPTMEKQRVFCGIMDKVVDSIELRKKQLGYFDKFTKSLFIEMFGDLKSNSKKWIKKTFTDIASIDTNMINVFDNYENYPHIGIESIEKETGEIIGYRTVKEDKVVSGKYLFTEQHIIYSKIRPNLNKVALPKCKGVCSADAYPILVKIDECHRVFLAYTMRSKIFLDYIIKLSNRTNLPKVNKKQVEGFICPVPPLDLQNRFADYVSSIDKSKLAVKKSLEELEILKKSLMQKYFD